MRIVLDMQGAQTTGSRHRGIGRYSMSLAAALARAGGCKIDLRIALNSAFSEAAHEIIDTLSPDLPRSAFSFYTVPAGTYPPPVQGDPIQSVAAQVARLHYASLEPHCVIISSLFEGYGAGDLCPFGINLPGVVSCAVLYDLIPLILRERFPDPSYLAFYERQLNVLKHTDCLLSISESSKRDAVRVLGLDEERVTNIGAAVSSTFHELERGPRPDIGTKKEYMLFSGGIDPNKNLALAVEAFARLPDEIRRKHDLVHVGVLAMEARNSLLATARRRGVRDIVFLGHVSDRRLIDVLDHARVFLFPSIYEGFGLPVLEAMTRGTPVLASKRSSLPEIVAREDYLFDPDDPDDLAQRLERLLTNPELRADSARYCRERADYFSWDAVGGAALAAVEKTLFRLYPGQLIRRRPPKVRVEHALSASARTMADAGMGNSAEQVIDALLISGRVGAELGDPRLLVDVTATDTMDHGTGIQRVVRSIVGSLQRHFDNGTSAYQAVPVALRKSGLEIADRFLTAESRLGYSGHSSITPRTGDTLLMLDSTWEHYGEFLPVFTELRAAGGSVFSTVYDLVPYLHPEFVDPPLRPVFEEWFRLAVLQSDGLVCISRSVAREVCTFLADHRVPYRDGLKIGWWHLGCDVSADETGIRDPIRHILCSGLPTFLMVGTIEPRKRHAVVLDSMERLWAAGQQARLLLLGKAGWRVQSFVHRMHSHPELNRRLFWFEDASDSEIALAYRQAAALIFASAYEGFGLPIIEAARGGIPVISSNIPVLREVGGDGALYFTVDDVESLVNVISVFLSGGVQPDSARIRTLTWDESADRLLDVLYGGRCETILRL